jgi:hypothetical protein
MYNPLVLIIYGFFGNLGVPYGSVPCQAQLRGICVVSSASYGLREANFIEATSTMSPWGSPLAMGISPKWWLNFKNRDFTSKNGGMVWDVMV